ncbi:MAG: hypothetical protein H7Z74_13055 [Anaerolineae bacterium]|nr:hypothetical protein [Gemmatimonadaceae bacterium]
MKLSEKIAKEVRSASSRELPPYRLKVREIQALLTEAAELAALAYYDRLELESNQMNRMNLNEEEEGHQGKILEARIAATARAVLARTAQAATKMAAALQLSLGSTTVGNSHAQGLSADEFIWLETFVRGGL